MIVYFNVFFFLVHSLTMKNQQMMTVTLMNMKACSYLYKQTLERRSRFAMVAKFLDENVTLKLNLHCFKLHRLYSVSFNLSNVGKIFWG